MTNRKRRLKKGIKSLQEQIESHIKKKEYAEESGNEELMNYYEKEIIAKEKTKQEKQELLKKQQY